MLPLLYHAHHTRNSPDLDFWRELAAAHVTSGGSLLELGCGSGRVLIPLLQAGFSVTGLDNDPEMLRFLRARLAELPPETAARAEALEADMTAFALNRRFSLILLPCNTLSTLDAQARRQALRCVAEHLSPGGLFAAGLPNPQLFRDLPRRGEEELEDEFSLPDGGQVRVSSAWRRSRREFSVFWHYDHTPPGGRTQRYSMQALHTLDRLETYLDDLRAAGLELQVLYGGFDRSDFEQDSDEVILLAGLA